MATPYNDNDTWNGIPYMFRPSLHGNSVGNTIDGLDGNDKIYGYGGNDYLYGSAGNDQLYGHNDHDTLNGGAGADTMYGGTENDTLDGGTGADTMYGGTGNDAYYVDTMQDKVIEYASQGTDRVYSSVSTNYKWLPANVENLTLIGTASFGDGNDLNNSISGNASANALYGYGGNDYLYGYGGNDMLNSGAGGDTLYGGDGNDKLNGEADGDKLYGQSGTDAIDGGAGWDTLDGGTGDDYLDGGTDVDTITGGWGNDRFDFSDVGDEYNGDFPGATIKDFGFAAGNNDTIGLQAQDGEAFEEGLVWTGGVESPLNSGWYFEGSSTGNGALDLSGIYLQVVDADTGNLYYNPTSDKAFDSHWFATIDVVGNVTDLSAADFVLI